MPERTKAIVRGFLRSFDAGDWETWATLAHDDHVFHIPIAPGPLDRDGHLQLSQGFRQSFSPTEHVIDDMVAEGSSVAVRGRLRITHSGEFQGIPATGRTLEIGFMDFLRVEDGRIREEWVELDAARLMGALSG